MKNNDVQSFNLQPKQQFSRQKNEMMFVTQSLNILSEDRINPILQNSEQYDTKEYFKQLNYCKREFDYQKHFNIKEYIKLLVQIQHLNKCLLQLKLKNIQLETILQSFAKSHLSEYRCCKIFCSNNHLSLVTPIHQSINPNVFFDIVDEIFNSFACVNSKQKLNQIKEESSSDDSIRWFEDKKKIVFRKDLFLQFKSLKEKQFKLLNDKELSSFSSIKDSYIQLIIDYNCIKRQRKMLLRYITQLEERNLILLKILKN